MKKYIIYAGLLLSITACNQPSEEKAMVTSVRLTPPVVKADAEDKDVVAEKDAPVAEAIEAPPQTDQAVAGTNNTSPQPIVKNDEKKIIKEGDISFETNNLSATRKGIINRVKNLGGYISDDSQSMDNDDNRLQYNLKVRVPAKNFDGLLDSVSANANKIDSKHISVTDVTTKFIDESTRLQNKKKLESRYLELLKKATRMADMLAIEDKLNEIQSDIESAQGQLDYMSKQIAYSSLDITFYEKNVNRTAGGNSFGTYVNEALGNGTEFVRNFLLGIISLWPLWIVVAPGFLIIRRKMRKRRAAKLSPQS